MIACFSSFSSFFWFHFSCFDLMGVMGFSFSSVKIEEDACMMMVMGRELGMMCVCERERERRVKSSGCSGGSLMIRTKKE